MMTYDPYPWRDVPTIKAYNEENGYLFFSAGARSFFKSQVRSSVYAGRFFITSERGPRGERYSVRQAMPNAKIETLAYDLPTLEDARDFAKDYAKRVRKVSAILTRVGIKRGQNND